MKLVFESPLVPGQEYLLDGKVLVKLIKTINRAGTIFSVEIPSQSILTVEKQRLQPIQEGIESLTTGVRLHIFVNQKL